MFCHFDAQKATQAAAVIMRRLGKRISRLRLLKLLYIAERDAVKDRGHPIIGGPLVAMNNGPLHSAVYDLIKGNHPDEHLWSRFITTDGPRELLLTDEPPVELLSEYEITLLSETTERHDDLDDFDLVEATHGFGEWQKHSKPGTSTPIPMESVVEAVCDASDREEILQELRDKAVVDGIFSQAASS